MCYKNPTECVCTHLNDSDTLIEPSLCPTQHNEDDFYAELGLGFASAGTNVQYATQVLYLNTLTRDEWLVGIFARPSNLGKIAS